MVFKLKKRPNVYVGDIRTIEKFLFFPTKIGLEIRWLQKAKIKQKYYNQGGGELGETCVYWKNVAWMD